MDIISRWVEVESLAKITEANMRNFMWKNIICRHGIPALIVTENGKQFDNARVKDICDQLKISKTFSWPRNPKANGHVKSINKTIKSHLKKNLEHKKGAWVE